MNERTDAQIRAGIANLRAQHERQAVISRESREVTLAFITDYIEDHGWAPSYSEIMEGTGIMSRSTVHDHLHRLESEGKLILGRGPRGSSRMIALPR